MQGFNDRRFALARKRRGLTKQQLAVEVGVSRRIITAYERGEKQPTAASIEKLADVLSCPPDAFFGDDIDEPGVDGTSFRALTSMTARTRDQALGAAAQALALAGWLDERFVLPAPNVPRYEGAGPETAADTVRSEWGLGERPIKNMIHELEAQGVKVFSLPEECASIDAFSFWRDDCPFVFLNARKSTEHSRMDCAHELGHLVLHYRGIAHGRQAEREAAAFASAFLMPRGTVLANAPFGGTLPQLIRAKRTWRVSLAALAYRMHDLKMLSDWQYRMLFVQISRRGYRTDEPQAIEPERSQILEKVFRGLKNEGMTKADVARELHMSVRDLNDVIFGLVMAPVAREGGTTEPKADRPRLQIVR